MISLCVQILLCVLSLDFYKLIYELYLILNVKYNHYIIFKFKKKTLLTNFVKIYVKNVEFVRLVIL